MSCKIYPENAALSLPEHMGGLPYFDDYIVTNEFLIGYN